MTGASYFYADAEDTHELLDYLHVGGGALLRPWPLTDNAQPLSRQDAASVRRVLIVESALGAPVFIGANDPALKASTASGVFNRLNMDAAQRAGSDTIVDFDASPVLLWSPGSVSTTQLRVGSIGTQATSPRAISADYDKWVKRVASWIRRRGTAVWGLQTHAVQPELDIELPFLNSVYALPGALQRLREGARGR
ncbi:hypothetical protein SK224_09080 [Microbacterium sp. BG28]|uniref:hypothetical protein n=1 Tax=Microbacterium sp. BG28 TaxID=3097356 RepID=UPI002A5A18D1|nr:hypothetical protein [Microbacterium sp. BG28]MDY0829278.1 hypothetical protein [Microbacterium sp. BG28]